MKERVIRTNSFADDAVNIIADAARSAVATNGLFRLSLCGGGTPKPIYSRLADSHEPIDWPKVQLTFGDERCVPPDHADSNYRMAREALLDHVDIAKENVFRMHGEDDPSEAAAACQRELHQVAARFGEVHYVHDLILLGLGGDGHTASLFPGTEALEITDRDVTSNHVPKLDADRITFTYPLINAARHVCFLVNDSAKKDIVEEIRSGKSDYPAGKVRPETGELTWLLGY